MTAAGWSRYLPVEDPLKLDQVQMVRHEGNLAAAATLAQLFRSLPITL